MALSGESCQGIVDKVDLQQRVGLLLEVKDWNASEPQFSRDLASLSTKELKQLLLKHEVDVSKCFDRQDLVDSLRKLDLAHHG